MRPLGRIIIIIILLATAAGCQVQELNNSAVVSGMGVELDNEQQIRLSLQMASPTVPGQSSGDSEPAFKVVSETGRSFTESLKKMVLSFPRDPILSQSNLLILGENLASTDLAWIADVSLRNPEIRKSAGVVVARDASPEDILNTEVLLESLSAVAINKLLENQETQVGIYQEVTYDQFLNNLAEPGVEPAAPQVSLFDSLNGKAIKLNGTAVFKGRKMVGELNARESRGFRLINPGRIQGGLIHIPSPFGNQGTVGIEMIRSQTKVEPTISDGQIVMKIEFAGEGNYYEQTSSEDILKLDNIPILEKLTENRIKSDMQACVKQAQKLNSDILGWGTMVNAKNPDLWNEISDKWDQLFPGVQTDIRVDFSIRRTYLTSSSLIYK